MCSSDLDAERDWDDIDYIAATSGPGLPGALVVGLNAARGLAFARGLPFTPPDHIEGHVCANWLTAGGNTEEPPLPALALVVSGGHTELLLMHAHGAFTRLGGTRDDAAGEAFDKGARLLGLPYPGGPQVAQLAASGNPAAIDFPRALPQRSESGFSFSGLKTSLQTYLSQNPSPNLPDVCASFQEAIVDALVRKTVLAAERGNYRDIVVAGGVAANQRLREKLQRALPVGVRLHVPSPKFCTDNGAMIAALGAVRFRQEDYVEPSGLFQIEVSPSTEAKLARGKVK